jgi:hypothetical protein
MKKKRDNILRKEEEETNCDLKKEELSVLLHNYEKLLPVSTVPSRMTIKTMKNQSTFRKSW